MLIGLRQRLKTFETAPSLSISGASIKQVSCAKSLGVLIDETLSWNEHIKKLTTNTGRKIGFTALLTRVKS